MICAIDNTKHETREDLHKHLRKLRVKQTDYYTHYEPRYCRYNGTPIEFKNWSDYLAADFSSKSAMQSWMVANAQEAKTYAAELIGRRTADKGLTFTPCEVELKSVGYPRARYYESIGGLNAIGSRYGLRERFNYTTTISTQERDLTAPLIIDTREQLPLDFPNVIRTKLQFGDYAFEQDQSLAVERKSLQDLIGSVVADYERFIREIERVSEVGGYLVVACEASIHEALTFDENAEIARHTKLKPQVVFHNVREIIQRFECVQFLFCNGRDELRRIIPIVLSGGESVRHADLQHLYTEKKL